MLESVFSRVWYNLNASRLPGTAPVAFLFFSDIIGMQDECWKYLCLLFVGGGGFNTNTFETSSTQSVHKGSVEANGRGQEQLSGARYTQMAQRGSDIFGVSSF